MPPITFATGYMVDLRKSLSQLEPRDWGTVPDDASPMIRRLAGLQHKPIGQFDIEDLGLCLGQEIGTKFLLPLALAHLAKDPYSEGTHYKGDLLCNVLRIDRKFYGEYPQFKRRVEILLVRARRSIPTLDEIDAACLLPALAQAAKEFDGN
ncbi:contact-dependent growth inhibition system immunity protein [Massilia violaceinigra]|uniref:contact-dependent growth inhibition system immunity protein n=1 Tax=Massilia violaceinigra TaxID=2045208 RepID=UPI0012FD5EBD|nr:contact-dependent growth inhibition system immunity protein [Massilia violaceinigra]